MKITPYLTAMVEREASDLYLTTGAPASLKIMGNIRPLTKDKLQAGNIAILAKDLLREEEWHEFEETKEMNKGLSIPNTGRFRVNIYYQRGEVSMVIRHIRSEIKQPHELGLPDILQTLIMGHEGLLLFVGSTGSGKSTSMASLIEYRNQHSASHILTIEDPIEFAFRHARSIVGQREVGFDTLSYKNAMREAMREAPDMIMIGETRDTDTMEALIGFADTGHLVISTLHATNTTQAIERILYMFSADQKSKVLMDLSLSLKGIIAQRLVPTVAGGVTLATEVLINTPFVAECIRNGHIQQLKELIEKGQSDGMHTFDQSLIQLYKTGTISKANALHHASSKNNLDWQINFENQGKEEQEGSNGQNVKGNADDNQKSLPELLQF